VTNRGRTEAPFGATVRDASVCDLADIGGLVEGATPGSTLCPTRTLPLPFDGRPRDVTRDPAGVFGMFGGMRELVFMSVTNPPGWYSRQNFACEIEPTNRVVFEGEGYWDIHWTHRYTLGPYSLHTLSHRGGAWCDDRRLSTGYAYSAGQPDHYSLSDGVEKGFRCQRWERPR
jgi:hypothetical protein